MSNVKVFSSVKSAHGMGIMYVLGCRLLPTKKLMVMMMLMKCSPQSLLLFHVS